MEKFPFGGSAGYIIASVILGLDYLDRSEVNQWDPADLGTPVWNDDFDT